VAPAVLETAGRALARVKRRCTPRSLARGSFCAALSAPSLFFASGSLPARAETRVGFRERAAEVSPAGRRAPIFPDLICGQRAGQGDRPDPRRRHPSVYASAIAASRASPPVDAVRPAGRPGVNRKRIVPQCRSRSTGNPRRPRSPSISDRLTLPISGKPMPRSHRPNAISGASGSISVRSQVHATSGVNSFTTGRWSGGSRISLGTRSFQVLALKCLSVYEIAVRTLNYLNSAVLTAL
jgi:hypothetical protein